MTGGEELSRSFKFFLWTRLLGTAANQMLLVALGWQMYDLTGSAWDLGLVGLLQFIPALVLTIPAGQLVDRVDRRRVLAASLAIQGLAALLLAWASGTHWIQRDLILQLSVAMGIARALQMPSQQAIVPSLVRQGLPNARLAGREIEKRARVDAEGRGLLRDALSRLGLSARAHHRVLKVARTIADLRQSPEVRSQDVAEALRYRGISATR